METIRGDLGLSLKRSQWDSLVNSYFFGLFYQIPYASGNLFYSVEHWFSIPDVTCVACVMPMPPVQLTHNGRFFIDLIWFIAAIFLLFLTFSVLTSFRHSFFHFIKYKCRVVEIREGVILNSFALTVIRFIFHQSISWRVSSRTMP